MITRSTIAADVERLAQLKVLVETYETIASMSMRGIRLSVLQNRAFHEGLNAIFREVVLAHRADIKHRAKHGGASALSGHSLAPKNNKKALVLISANTGLYGEIVGKTFQLFLQEYRRGLADAVIVGKLGASLFETVLP